ncbi:E3 ubiquitin-protein ligase RNF123-like [Adelges cooleyi]|uniref:E3 ubiquitin-protein ligase RNF123-like n=1 Tax=Adelges cooleyi TaxID=133065 RepID=UPI002180144D|nr:E3 ubiquitin-protein ligase RNF123-like [Adelges cooleyi]
MYFEEILVEENMFFKSFEYFNTKNQYGNIVYTPFDTIHSRNGMATIKANYGVSSGMYQYEVQLCTNGIIHIGWATQACVFTDSTGVGETLNSYGFDGYRTEKWNNSVNSQYGTKWRVGNIIGCVIDFTDKTIEYFNNGQSLGKAFEDMNIDSLSFYPAISLNSEETVSVNLGKRPFKFIVDGARSIIDSPTVKDARKRNNQIIVRDTLKTILLRQLGTLASVPYLTDVCLMEFIEALYKRKPKDILVFLEMMWTYIEENNMDLIMQNISFFLLTEFKCIWRNGFDTSHQIMVIKLLIEFCQETKTRRHLIKKILFDKVRVSYFLHIIAPSDEIFQLIVPDAYWSLEHVELADDNLKSRLMSTLSNGNRKHSKSSYKNACARIQEAVNSIETQQIAFLEKLLNDNDQTETEVSSRVLFSRRLHGFIQENMIYWRSDPMFRLPGPVLLSTFFRLAFVLQRLWKQELMEYKLVQIYPNIFYVDSFNYYGIERIGGTFSYLKNKYKNEIDLKLRGTSGTTDGPVSESNDSVSSNEEVIEIDSAAGFMAVLTRFITEAQERSANVNMNSSAILRGMLSSHSNLPTDKRSVLSEMLNNVVCLYNIAGHKQLIEYVSFKERLIDLTIEHALINYEIKTSTENRENNERLLTKIYNQATITSRHMAWLMSMIFVEPKEQILCWILMVVANTIKNCSEFEEELFRFVPEFYPDCLIGLTVTLPDYSNEIQQYESIVTDKRGLALLISEILLQHFEDVRIANPKTKECILQGITLYLTDPQSVEVLETASESSRMHAIQSIFKPQDQKTWTKTNIVLMMIWFGSGYGFRHTIPPHLNNRKIPYQDTMEDILFINMGKERPPAYVLQNNIKSIIAQDKPSAVIFLNNSLNHLNWAFSEFISVFQEIKDMDLENKTSITSDTINKLRMCSTCFALSVTLLRVIEMLVVFDRNLITDQEGSLERITQLICQILNRVNTSTNTFQLVSSLILPYTESIHKFAILVAITGVLLAMLQNEIDSQEKSFDESSKIAEDLPITKVIISDPNFAVSSLEFIVLPQTDSEEPFALNSYTSYLTSEELSNATNMHKHLVWYMKRRRSLTSGINEDDLCLLCYSAKKNIIIMPCKHQCCKLCINHHLLYSRVCFYCKGRIELVVDSDDPTIVLHDFSKDFPSV